MHLRATFPETLVGGHKEDPWKRDMFDLNFAHGDEELAIYIAKAMKASGYFKEVTLYKTEQVPVEF